MTPTESKLVRCLIDAEAFIAEGRTHHAHLIIQQSIAEYRASLKTIEALVAFDLLSGFITEVNHSEGLTTTTGLADPEPPKTAA